MHGPSCNTVQCAWLVAAGRKQEIGSGCQKREKKGEKEEEKRRTKKKARRNRSKKQREFWTSSCSGEREAKSWRWCKPFALFVKHASDSISSIPVAFLVKTWIQSLWPAELCFCLHSGYVFCETHRWAWWLLQCLGVARDCWQKLQWELLVKFTTGKTWACFFFQVPILETWPNNSLAHKLNDNLDQVKKTSNIKIPNVCHFFNPFKYWLFSVLSFISYVVLRNGLHW